MEVLNPLFDISNLRDSLKAGETIITSNLRLSRKLRDAWHRDRCNAGVDTWDEPQILPLESWLETCWLDLQDAAFPPALAGIVVTPQQEALLWQQVISADPDLPPTANPDNFADLACRGWKLVRQWQLQDSHLANSFHEGARFLLKWGNAYERSLSARELISLEQRELIVLQGFDAQTLIKAPAITLVGFQTLPPLHRALLEKAANKLSLHQPPTTDAKGFQFCADNIEHEIFMAAEWAKTRSAENPQARVGIVIPKLTSLQANVERAFSYVLDPAAALPTSTYRPAPYNISAAHPLSEAPVVASALSLLSLLSLPGHKLSPQDYCAILTSPFWGNADAETGIRCRVQKALRELGLIELPPSRFRLLTHQLEADDNDAVTEYSLSYRLTKLATFQRSLTTKLSYAAWQQVFSESLAILGWPGTRSPDSLEYQQLEHWHRLLTTLPELDQVAAPVDVGQALQALSELAAGTAFHAETPDNQIQILGTLEAAGLAFDYLWVMNLEDRQWPEPIAPHPLLPTNLQRQYAMPRATPERELVLARELFTLFSQSAAEVVFSYASREGDVNLNPSLFLEGLPSLSTDSFLKDFTSPQEALRAAPQAAHLKTSLEKSLEKNLETLHPWWSTVYNASTLELVEDATGPQYQPPANTLYGGSRFLSDQAQCPFNAFARWRLGATPLGESVSGLGPMWRGILVHRSMELFWRDISTSHRLSQLSSEELRQSVGSAVEQAMSSLFRQQRGLIIEDDFGRRFLEIEKKRLVNLLEQWLNLEKERSAFDVAHSELKTQLPLNDLLIRLQIDRVDRLADGSIAIIDYKTGQSGIGAVTGERLLETQLPLYALATKQDLGETPLAIAYGKINAKNMAFDGLAETKDLIPGCKSLAQKELPDNWEDTLTSWQASLSGLISEIQQGQAEVAFYSRQAASYGGDLVPLNRWPDLDRLSGRFDTGRDC